MAVFSSLGLGLCLKPVFDFVVLHSLPALFNSQCPMLTGTDRTGVTISAWECCGPCKVSMLQQLLCLLEFSTAMQQSESIQLRGRGVPAGRYTGLHALKIS